ncbi:hypothetical protein [Scytonema sp. NUACC26]|uniref:hypothetical protein n=1 Tax=Scytonema sp. NUACC26 TaxID=3140176 RepID=UPI0034DBBDFE
MGSASYMATTKQLNLLQKGEGEAADGCFSFPKIMIIILLIGDFIAWKSPNSSAKNTETVVNPLD